MMMSRQLVNYHQRVSVNIDFDWVLHIAPQWFPRRWTLKLTSFVARVNTNYSFNINYIHLRHARLWIAQRVQFAYRSSIFRGSFMIMEPMTYYTYSDKNLWGPVVLYIGPCHIMNASVLRDHRLVELISLSVHKWRE